MEREIYLGLLLGNQHHANSWIRGHISNQLLLGCIFDFCSNSELHHNFL